LTAPQALTAEEVEDAASSLLFDGEFLEGAAIGTSLVPQRAFLVGFAKIDHALWLRPGTRFRVQQQMALCFAYDFAVRHVTDPRGKASLCLSTTGEQK
jgi:hypothetical protein